MTTSTNTILVVDDTRENIGLVLNILGDEYDIVVATDGESALDILGAEAVDLVLLDIVMPGISGYEVCQKLKADPTTAEIPVIFITGMADEDSIEQGFAVGGVDYVTKPLMPRELIARVRTHLKICDLIKELEYLSYHDKMTGIYNRARFFQLAENLWLASDRLFAVMLDIDKFKLINDNYGHPIGDRVIKGVATTVANQLDDRAIFARVGGEEFAILLQLNSKKEAIALVEQLRHAVEQIEVSVDGEILMRCTISAGVAERDATMPGLDTLLKRADQALYDAKGEGRNRTVFRSDP